MLSRWEKRYCPIRFSVLDVLTDNAMVVPRGKERTVNNVPAAPAERLLARLGQIEGRDLGTLREQNLSKTAGGAG